MTRAVATGERTRIGGEDIWVYARPLVLDSDSVWRDLSNFQGYDWFVRATWNESIDDPSAALTLTLVRDGDGISLAPQMTASTANRDAANLYAPLLNPGRKIRLLTATMAQGQAPDVNYGVDESSWTLGSGWTLDFGTGVGGTPSLKHTGSGTAVAAQASFRPTVPGESWTATAQIKGVSADGNMRVRLTWFDAGGTPLSSNNGNTVTSDGAYHMSTVTATAPASTAFVKVEYLPAHTTGAWHGDANTLVQANVWKRVFDGRIDAVDPGGNTGLVTVRARDRAAWLLDTWIEDKNKYTTGTTWEAMIQALIDDNGVPGSPTLYTPTSPFVNITAPGYEQDKGGSVMEAIQERARKLGWDLRYLFNADGDVDPQLTFYEPPRTKTTPDWTFAAGEYTAVPKAELSDASVRNAVTVEFRNAATGLRERVTQVNTTSITAFGRRWGEDIEADGSAIDSVTAAERLGDAIVADLGFPLVQHELETFYFWPLSINDLVRFSSDNAVMHDTNLDLAVVGFTHTLENGHGTTVMQCRGTPAGAYRTWLTLPGPGSGPTSSVVLAYEVISQTASTITIQVNASVADSALGPAVALMWTGYNPPVSKLAGAAPGVFVANHSQWTFSKPVSGGGPSSVGFGASGPGFAGIILTVPIPEADAGAGSSVATPTITPNVNPTNTFTVNWTPTSAPAVAKYSLYWRSEIGDPWTEVNHSVIGTANTYTIPQSDHGYVIVASGGTLKTMQVYVEMYSSAGVYITPSSVGQSSFRAF